MQPTPAELIARVLDAALIGEAAGPVLRLETDSRHVVPGDLFVALPGERTDGHRHLGQAAERGAVAALVREDRLPGLTRPEGTALVAVPDTVDSLGVLAAWHRNRFAPAVSAVTGSVGKTTTKDLLGAILTAAGPVCVSPGNRNTEIGLPVALMDLEPVHRAAVFELGMRGTGQIRRLARLVRPQVVIITNIGSSHQELLGSRQAIAAAKAEALDFLPEGGTAVLPAESDFLDFLRERTPPWAQVLTFGSEGGPPAGVEVRYLGSGEPRNGALGAHLGAGAGVGVGAEIELRLPAGERFRAWIPVPGRHNAVNAAAAAAAAVAVGIGPGTITEGLAGARVSAQRMSLFYLRNGITLLDDSYNASSPETMLAALSVLQETPAARRGAVLGSMLELGTASGGAHAAVGRRVAALRPDYLLTVGDAARGILEAAVGDGYPPGQAVHCADAAEALRALRPLLAPADAVLVKGSRGVALEHLVGGLRSEAGE